MKWTLHLGMGKTGTSSIQKVLSVNRASLLKDGIQYLGVNLDFWPESVALTKRVKVTGSAVDDLKKNPDRFYESCVNLTNYSRKQGLKSIIWSNESLFLETDFTLGLIARLVDSGVEVETIIYVRNHGAWLRSAYQQWGIRHKTYRGRLLSFPEWFKVWDNGKNKIAFSPKIKEYSEISSRLILRNYDACGDVIKDFSDILNINLPKVEQDRKNVSPGPFINYLHAIFNSSFKEPVSPKKFRDFLKRSDLSLNGLSDFSWAAYSVENYGDSEIEKAIIEDNSQLNKLLKRYKQDSLVLDLAPPTMGDFDRDSVDVALMGIIIGLERRINELELKLAERPDSDD